MKIRINIEPSIVRLDGKIYFTNRTILCPDCFYPQSITQEDGNYYFEEFHNDLCTNEKLLGYSKSKPEVSTQSKQDPDKKQKIKEGIKPGFVKRPTPERNEYLRDPKKREEEDEVKKIMKPLVEGIDKIEEKK